MQMPAKADDATPGGRSSALGTVQNDTPGAGDGAGAPDAGNEYGLPDAGNEYGLPDAGSEVKVPVSGDDAPDELSEAGDLVRSQIPAGTQTELVAHTCNNSKVTKDNHKKMYPKKKIGDPAVDWYGAGLDGTTLANALRDRPTGSLWTCLTKVKIVETKDKKFDYYAVFLQTNWHNNFKGREKNRARGQLDITSSISGDDWDATDTYISRTDCDAIQLGVQIGSFSLGAPTAACKDYEVKRTALDDNSATWKLSNVGGVRTTTVAYFQQVKQGKVPKFSTVTYFPYHSVKKGTAPFPYKWSLKVLKWPINL